MTIKYDNNDFNDIFKGGFKLSTTPTKEIGYETGYWETSYSNLKPNTRYKLMIEGQNFLTERGDNSRTQEFYDITRFAKPYGSSILQNNLVRITDPTDYKPLTQSGGVWYHSYFYSDDSGQLFLKVYLQSLWKERLQNGGRAIWNIKKYDQWREDAKQAFSLVPYVDAVDPDSELPDETLPIAFVKQPKVVAKKPNSDKSIQNASSSVIQTFFIDPNNVDNSSHIDLTDVTLYFKQKPRRIVNKSGKTSPGVYLTLIDVEKGVPVLNSVYEKSIVNKLYTDVVASSDASASTVFTFKDPVRLKTGRHYGISVTFQDPDYKLWTCKSGDKILGTNTASPGPNKEHKGKLFQRTNASMVANQNYTNSSFSKIYIPVNDQDLKFEVHVAEYNVQGNDIFIVNNKDQEYLTISNPSGEFFGAEYVYKQAANTAGTISVVGGSLILNGVGTTFSALNEFEKIVLIDSSDPTIKEIVEVGVVVSDTQVRLAEPCIRSVSGNFVRTVTGIVRNYIPYTKKLILGDSSANTSSYFEANDVLVGIDSNETATLTSVDDLNVSSFSTDFDLNLPSTFSVTGVYNFVEKDSLGNYTLSTRNLPLDLIKPNHIDKYNGVVLSKSLEMTELSGQKSANVAITMVYNGPKSVYTYESPEINIDNINLSSSYWKINNDVTGEEGLYGSAATKHVSNKLTFSDDQSAEDIRVIYNAYRPVGTDVLCYAKILNKQDPESFDDKSWTLLEMKSNFDEFSSSDNYGDFKEFEFGFPDYPPVDSTLAGTITTSQGNTSITGAGTTFTNITNGDVIRIYNPLFPTENYGIFCVDTVNSNTSITLTEPVTNTNIVGEGLKIDTLETPYTAFNNKENLNIVRYFGSNGESYDNYDVVAIKTVLTSDDGIKIPRVNDYRVIGVSS